MDDLEMTRLCAQAMGIELCEVFDHDNDEVWVVTVEEKNLPGFAVRVDRTGDYYDPLHDDAQAMALVKKFSIDIYHHAAIGWSGPITATLNDDTAGHKGESEDLNRAIVEAVAKMQRSTGSSQVDAQDEAPAK